jgi:hypothetical protein
MKRVVHHDGILSWARGALSSLFEKVSMLGVDKRELGEFSVSIFFLAFLAHICVPSTLILFSSYRNMLRK